MGKSQGLGCRIKCRSYFRKYDDSSVLGLEAYRDDSSQYSNLAIFTDKFQTLGQAIGENSWMWVDEIRVSELCADGGFLNVDSVEGVFFTFLGIVGPLKGPRRDS
jgi:hypothetical protein